MRSRHRFQSLNLENSGEILLKFPLDNLGTYDGHLSRKQDLVLRDYLHRKGMNRLVVEAILELQTPIRGSKYRECLVGYHLQMHVNRSDRSVVLRLHNTQRCSNNRLSQNETLGLRIWLRRILDSWRDHYW